jgi:hypothetical protein
MSAPPGVPQTLDQVRAVKDREARIHAATAYIEAGESKIQEARRLRDDDIRWLATRHGPAEAARRSGLSLSTVKAIKGRP